MQQQYKTQNNLRLAAYSAMAAALTATLSDASAEVVYNDIDDVTVGVGDVFEVDVDGDGTFDFVFQGGSTTGTGGVWSFVSVFGFISSAGIGNAENQIIGYTGSFYNYGSALVEGALIGPDGPWLDYPSLSNSAVLASNFYGSTYGQFPGLGERFIGFQFTVLGNIHYGWMRVEADIDPAYVTIYDYAYEANPGQPIEAGSLESTINVRDLPAGTIQAYSFDQTVFINQNGSLTNPLVTVYDLSGKQVFAATMQDNAMQIDLSRCAAGNYLVHIGADAGQYTKQVHIQ